MTRFEKSLTQPKQNKAAEFFHHVFNSSRRLPEIYGGVIALGLIAFFFFSLLIGAIHIVELRMLNVLILVGGIYAAIRQYKRTHREELNYFRGLVIGTGATFIGVSIFVVFLFFYMVINEDFMEMLKRTDPAGPYLDPYIATSAVWLEGFFSGMIATFFLCNSIRTEPATKV